jgi:hypothetical protein
MKPVTLAAFNTREEAEPLRAWLCSQGIWAEVRNESDTAGLLEFARPSAGVRVEVPREDFENALQLVYDWNVAADAGVKPGNPWHDPVPRRETSAARDPHLDTAGPTN